MEGGGHGNQKEGGGGGRNGERCVRVSAKPDGPDRNAGVNPLLRHEEGGYYSRGDGGFTKEEEEPCISCLKGKPFTICGCAHRRKISLHQRNAAMYFYLYNMYDITCMCFLCG